MSPAFAPSDEPPNPLDELDREMALRAKSAPAQKEAGPLDELDKEFANNRPPQDRDPWPGAQDITSLLPGRTGEFIQEAGRGLLRTPARIIGGIYDLPSHLASGAEPETGERFLNKMGVGLDPNASGARRAGDVTGNLAGVAGLGLASGAGLIPAVANVAGSQLGGSGAEAAARGLGASPAWQARAGFLGSTLGGISAGRYATGRVNAPKLPNATQLHDAGQAIFHELDDMQLDLNPQTVGAVAGNIKDALKLGQGRELNMPTVNSWVNKLQPSATDQTVPFSKVWNVRQGLGDLLTKPDPTERFGASIAREHIDQFIQGLKDNPGHVLGGDPEAAATVSDKLAEANANWAGYKQLDTFNRLVARGLQKTGNTYTGGNLYNQMGAQFGRLSDPNFPQRMAGWSSEAKDLARALAKGGNTEQVLRVLSKMAPDNLIGVLTQLGSLGTSLMAANPALFATTAVGGALGFGARGITRAMQRGKLRALRSAIASPTPLAKQMNMPWGAPGGIEPEAEEAGAGALIQEYLPEATHHIGGAGADITGIGTPDRRRHEDTGGYSMGHRLLKAIGYDYGKPATPNPNPSQRTKTEQARPDPTIPMTNNIGGYDDPRNENFADPQAFRLRLARLAAMPQTGIGGGSPMPSYQVGGYDWPWSMKGAKSRPEPVDTGGTGSRYLFGSFSTVSKPHPPKGGASMQDPQGEPDTGGYDDPYASNPMSPDFQFGQQTGGLLGAIGAGVNRGIIEPFANNVAGSIPAPYESPAAVAPALWNAIGRARGARRFGGYGMSAVSPLVGGGGF